MGMYPPGKIIFMRPLKTVKGKRTVTHLHAPKQKCWDAVWISAYELIGEGILLSKAVRAGPCFQPEGNGLPVKIYQENVMNLSGENEGFHLQMAHANHADDPCMSDETRQQFGGSCGNKCTWGFGPWKERTLQTQSGA